MSPPLLRRRSPRGTAPGFTLVEVLVVLGVMLVLSALLFPALRQAVESSQRAKCVSIQRKMAAAAQLYAADAGCFPTSIYASGRPANDRPYWPQYLTDYMDVENTAANRTLIYQCPKPAADGRSEYQIYNMWMGFRDDDQLASNQRYIRVKSTAVPSPGKTSIFTCGFSRQPELPTQRNYYYRSGRGSGTASVNRTKFGGGANWAFVDGHVEWLSEEDVKERSGPTGQAVPFIKPF